MVGDESFLKLPITTGGKQQSFIYSSTALRGGIQMERLGLFSSPFERDAHKTNLNPVYICYRSQIGLS